MRRALAGALATTVATALALVPAPAYASNDPRFAEQWGLANVGAPAAWATGVGAGVRIGVVDTGIDFNHEDLAGKVVASTSCIGAAGDQQRCTGSAQDDNGHGTHVAGIAAATKDNGKGVAGVAPGASLVVAKVLAADGSGADADVSAGIKWVVDNGAKVVNLSLGDSFLITTVFGPSLREALDYAWARGAVPVLASGNTNLLGLGIGSSNYGDTRAVVVGAVDRANRVTSYSSPLGTARWSVVAPGGAGSGVDADDVLSTFWEKGKPNAYTALAGTSMATPHVAGAIALLLGQGLSPQAAVDRLLGSANSSISCGSGSPTCRGLLDVRRAVTGTPTPPPAPPPARPPRSVGLGALFDLLRLLDLLR